MRFLANENIPLIVVEQLIEGDFDIISLSHQYKGAGDKDILSKAVKENRIILTFDKDYGYLIFRQKELLPPGVIFLRISPKSPEYIFTCLVKVLKSGLPLEGHFTVISEKKIRSIPLKR